MGAARSKRSPLPTPAEARLLRALWSLGQGTVEQIVASFPPAEQPNYKTTHTFLRIMEAKGFVDHINAGRAFIFRPLLEQDEVARSSVRALLAQSFGGSVSGLFVNLLESGTLKPADLTEIEGLIQRYRETNREAAE